ncbi:putative NAD(P)H-dependent D-xylose reductase xyl1 [Leucosporidium creatinivorum]|uniref:Putative NAD(P)H-dependent D-xylose reductase xyl1 n=1 Tax=Leucosporidium creatinivorum TaxID=106004 RepID=A0A1Y2G7G9_9BASI|nr:putative NAD(P)H-dependent D-xylose reductase xyl1 [Leucosporidium creatinivorum]
MAPASTYTLSTGAESPLTGFGLWKVTENTAEVVYNALKAGYRLLDGAADYQNEVEAGKGLRRAIDEGIVKREDVFITSKLWNTFHAYEHVLPAAKRSLADWGVDYFDLYLIHFPISLKYVDPAVRYPPEWDDGNGVVTPSDDPIHLTWKGMEDVYSAGLAKAIGVSNFSGGLLIDLVRYAKVKPAVLQIEHHPYFTQPQLVELAKTLGVAVTAYSSFGPASWLELNHDLALKTPSLLEHSTISSIAKKHNKTTAQVLLRWATQRGIAVIPKSNNPARAKENLESVLFDLEKEDIKAISALNENRRLADPVAIHPALAIYA